MRTHQQGSIKMQAPTSPRGTLHLIAPEFLEALKMIPAPEYSMNMLAVARDMVAQMSAMPVPAPLASVAVEERYIQGPVGHEKLRVLLYRPPRRGPEEGPAILQIHGGGFVLGTPEMEQNLARRFALDFQCLVVSVDYRLAPETPFPGALDDCYAALTWLYRDSGALGIDRRRIALAGNSAGGGHAAALAIHARDQAEIPICLQILDQPMLDDRTGSSAPPHPYCGEFGHTAASNHFGWKSLLGVEPGSVDVPVKAVPARVQDLSGLPPAFIAVGALDLFLDESLTYAQRLMRAGVAAELHVVPGAFHGFELATDAPQVRALRELRRSFVERTSRAAMGGG
jgi:triacylglycerol lipase